MMAPGVGSACRVEASKSTASCFFWWDDQPAIPQASKTGEEPGARQGLKNNCSFVSKSGRQTIRRTDKATLNERLGCAIKNFTLCAWTMCHLHTFLCLTIICATWSSTCPLHFHSLLLNMGLNYLFIETIPVQASSDHYYRISTCVDCSLGRITDSCLKERICTFPQIHNLGKSYM